MFDAILHREIKSGREFEGLFPPSLQTKTKLGTGDTSLTIELMIDMIQKTLGQTKKVAKKLQKSSLKETIKSVHQFLYWHFQYKADGTAQMLHSPSRSWENRHIGIDCKSYTILASSILSNLGIKHSIRKIKQPAFNPNQFTHVYVYVPAENMIIDGTILENKEPAFVEKKDFAMSLPHYGLNGVAKQSYWIDPKGRVRSFHSNTGLNGGLFETVKNLFNGVMDMQIKVTD
ncbi:MAG: transglutaminase-like domain-containing protein [Flavobacterium sp.]